MEFLRSDGEIEVRTAAYRLVFPKQRPFVDVETSDGRRIAELFVFSCVPPLDGRDDTY